MVATMPLPGTRAGLLVYILTPAESGTPVRARPIEWLDEGLSACNKPEEIAKESRVEKAYLQRAPGNAGVTLSRSRRSMEIPLVS